MERDERGCGTLLCRNCGGLGRAYALLHDEYAISIQATKTSQPWIAISSIQTTTLSPDRVEAGPGSDIWSSPLPMLFSRCLAGFAVRQGPVFSIFWIYTGPSAACN